MSSSKLTVIDFFCGAGGFSEGFRQQGFKIVMGIDNWRPAVDTHNLNHGLQDVPRDVLEFEKSIDAIYNLPDVDVIVGSPPCVLFSMSNRAGKADKTLGIRLIEAYLRVVVVKKHQPKSKLKAWFLENVPNSRKYLKPQYSFRDLGLSGWATSIGKHPGDVALEIERNGRILNAAEYGASQRRERFVCGEIVRTGIFPELTKTHGPDSSRKVPYISLGYVKRKMPAPNQRASKKFYVDPNYPSLRIKASEITDHFYDSGLYEVHWRYAQYMKVDHPFMGRMSFPEDENGPSRTIMATKSSNTREALIYKSEYKRAGDGEYRLPTIREISSLMGFPYVYQFSGGESAKWAQIGNAVCPPMSAALAKAVRREIGLKSISDSRISFSALMKNTDRVGNLNAFSEKKFENPPKRNAKAKFRKHLFKDGNMTVELVNFNPAMPEKKAHGERWYTAIFRGTGKDFKLDVLPRGRYLAIEKLILKEYKILGERFVKNFEKRFGHIVGKTHELQKAYVGHPDAKADIEPTKVVQEMAKFIEEHNPGQNLTRLSPYFVGTDSIPARQLLAMYAINRIVS